MFRNMLVVSVVAASLLSGCMDNARQTAGPDSDQLPNGLLIEIPDGQIIAAGILTPLEVTTFMYGTHRLDPYVLSSSHVNLDHFVGQQVIVAGHPRTPELGYDAPVLLEVSAIEPYASARGGR